VRLFARHDITRDPPFSRLDLLSCRNLLIYLNAALQQRLIRLFHFALKPDGFLVLGTSETIGAASDLFSLADRKHKIYARKSTPVRLWRRVSGRDQPQPDPD
jgi:two-component system CheB/CheR fusion protein